MRKEFKLALVFLFLLALLSAFFAHQRVQPGEIGMEKKPNRLSNSNSPYLLQHANNPVDWYPWGSEAFEKARKEEKLVFLSIGYSTCHWCHVMAHESFEDQEVANVLNKNYISIKVDREERPDIDKVYMDVCQAMTGSGGWPLTVIMTANKIPIFAGTYFPKQSRYGRVGLIDLLEDINNKWKVNREDILRHALKVKDTFSKNSFPGLDKISPEVLGNSVRRISALYDDKYGGFGQAPKFPTGHLYIYLLRQAHRTNNKELLDKVLFSLKSIYSGGIFDHLGYGFCRYSVDTKWIVPHFEKMLYDNAILALTYLEAWQLTKDPFYKQVIEKIFTYIQRDMRHKEGGFFSAENADSEGEEGKFYIFSAKEFEEIVKGPDAELLKDYYGISEKGSFENYTNVLHIPVNEPDFLKKWNISNDDLERKLKWAHDRLLAYRNKRIRPSLDDKILTAWNGLMISALARAGRILERKDWIDLAQNSADFIIEKMRDSNGKLYRSWRNNKTSEYGFLSDYTFFTGGLVDLYQATFKIKYLTEAVRLHDYAIKNFAGKDIGVFYDTSSDAEKLFVRPVNYYDGAIPSSVSTLALNSVYLSRLTGNMDYAKLADGIFNRFGSEASRNPSGFTRLLTAYDLAVNGGFEFVLSSGSDEETQKYVSELNKIYTPGSTILLVPFGMKDEIGKIARYVESFDIKEESPTLYVCETFQCLAPINDVTKIAATLKSVKE
jgi:uncharacterized protein YyaL (SSP411 family)